MRQRNALQLWSPAEIESGDTALLAPEHRGLVRELLTWGCEFLNMPHPDLGRDGPVCPFTKSSMNKELFLVATPQSGSDIEAACVTVLEFRDWYDELVLEIDPADRNFLSFVIPLPDFDAVDPAPLDALQGKLKDDFVRDGLMIGQFHPFCEQPGLWNNDFHPLRSPVPLLAIRIMVMYDLPFLIEEQRHLDAYLANFAKEIPPRVRTQLVSRMFART